MRSLGEIYRDYAGPDCHTGSDKGTVHSFIEVYEELFAPRRHAVRRALEVGILTGHSLRMWEDYFAGATVHGVDVDDQPMGIGDLRPMITEGTHNISLLDAADPVQVERHFGGMCFDVVIEDASHALDNQLAIYANFKNRMAPGGIYVIEDVADIDRDRATFETLDHERRIQILDRRSIKGRFDDVLVVVTGW